MTNVHVFKAAQARRAYFLLYTILVTIPPPTPLSIPINPLGITSPNRRNRQSAQSRHTDEQTETSYESYIFSIIW